MGDGVGAAVGCRLVVRFLARRLADFLAPPRFAERFLADFFAPFRLAPRFLLDFFAVFFAAFLFFAITIDSFRKWRPRHIIGLSPQGRRHPGRDIPQNERK
jgi:hypothetical protein